MASGNTLLVFLAEEGRPPVSGGATFDVRNNIACWDYDDTTGESVVFTGVLPRNYAGGGITVYLHWAATTATSGTGGWLVAFERIGDGQQDIDSDGFASAQTVTAATVPATSGHVKITNVAVSDGANMDSVAVGELFRLKVTRDVANDTATGDLELYAVELKET
jgi:hypothetical protein